MKRAQNFLMINDTIVRIGISHRIKHIICLTNQTQTFWFLQCEQNYLQESTQVRVGKGGTHVCVCNINSKRNKLYLVFMYRNFSIHRRMEKKDTLFLLENTNCPYNAKMCFPTLWSLCALQLLCQGITSLCNVLLLYPIFNPTTITLFIQIHYSLNNDVKLSTPQSVPTCRRRYSTTSCLGSKKHTINNIYKFFRTSRHPCVIS